MKLTIEIDNFKKGPKITLNREIEGEDLVNVDERCNLLLFLTDEQGGWEFFKGKGVLRIKLFEVEELKKCLGDNDLDAVSKSYIKTLTSIHRLEVAKKEATYDRELAFKTEIALKLNKIIQQLNLKLTPFII